MTGWPDGHAAWLIDETTVRLAYQSESYGVISTPTAARKLKSGATMSGSQVHTIDLDRAKLAEFLTNATFKGSDIVKATGLLYDTIYNIWGNEVKPNSQFSTSQASWGAEIKNKDGVPQHTDDPTNGTADLHQHSYCGSWYQPPAFYGADLSIC